MSPVKYTGNFVKGKVLIYPFFKHFIVYSNFVPLVPISLFTFFKKCNRFP